MDGEPDGFLRRRILAFGALLGLLLVFPTQDVLSGLTKPLVVLVLSTLGWAASDIGNHLVAGPLTVEWTPDCSGIDILLVLWGLMFWGSRHEKIRKAFLVRLALTLPAAVVANAGRVLFFIFWRKTFYPAVEPPELHFFAGFLMLVPLVFVFIPRRGSSFSHHLAHMGYLAAVISLVAIHASGPGGVMVTVCAIALLGLQRPQAHNKVTGNIMVFLWMIAALWIALTSMESMWLPLLLLAPWFGGVSLLFSPAALLVLGTIPLVASMLFWLPLGGILWASWRLLCPSKGDAKRSADDVACQTPRLGLWSAKVASDSPVERSNLDASRQTELTLSSRLSWRAVLILLAVIPLPFVSSSITTFSSGRDRRPPLGLMTRALPSGGYAIRMVDQSPDIRLYWYPAQGGGRHHSLPVCMRYRGVTLSPVSGADGTVLTDGEQWMTERFLFKDGSLVDTKAYLMKTFLPTSDPGVHLIAVASHGSMTRDDFYEATEMLFERMADCQKSQEIHRGYHEPEVSQWALLFGNKGGRSFLTL